MANYVWMSWKDNKHPLAGGAEVVKEHLAKRLAADGHDVLLLVGGFKGGLAEEKIDGYSIVRVGSRLTVYWQAYRYYSKNLRGWADVVIDEVNTIPFLAKFYVKEPTIMFFHMLCREIWFFQLGMVGWIGYWLEPVYVRWLNNKKVITVSESTKQDLLRYGFRADNISIISEGIEMSPIAAIDNDAKFPQPTMLALGMIRSMKRTDQIVTAFEIAKKSIPNLQLIVAGAPEGAYGARVVASLKTSPYAADIDFRGRVSHEEKQQLMQKASVLCVASIKEGWGLVVTEANSQGTPVVVYDADGLRDSVKNGYTGLITTDNTPEAMAKSVVQLLSNPRLYGSLQEKAWQWSKQITFDRSYEEFKKAVSTI